MKTLISIFLLAFLVACTAPSDDGLHIDQLPAEGEEAIASTLARGSFEVVVSEPTYYEGVQGYLAEPSTFGSYPGVILIHEWWGLNDNVKASADALASHGYRVLAVDLYNGDVAQTPQDAQKLVGGVDQEEAVTNMRSAVTFLRESGSEKIGSFGWCFGGKQSLQVALSGEPLDATVIYYGQLENNPDRLSAISWPVLGIFGREDTSIPVSSVEQFDAMLSAEGIEHEVKIYEGVGHAFANPSGKNYAPEQTVDAWEKTLVFLEQSLK